MTQLKTIEDIEKMIKWTDYGESSLTLLAVHCGMNKKKPAIPYEGSLQTSDQAQKVFQ